ncbi:spermatogenesis-associated protein 6-like [Corticium candelabrum]|uniref:spermatogenesis-associated protein 6-like n=1 Tax=Corticium candelabrum TaxID=121492 RepID=UPI002E25EDBE|nr:spermatogenesis-associated protein 6-like [Corticium candelabrum]
MGRSVLRIRATLSIYQIRSDGTFLSSRRRVWLRISLFGRDWNSKRVLPTFPIIVNESCKVERLFTNAWNLSSLSDILTADGVTLELVQHADNKPDGHVLARYETSVQDFLFPKQSAGSIHYITMKRTKHLKFAVQLSYSTQTVVEEVAFTRPGQTSGICLDGEEREQPAKPTHQSASHIIHSTPLHSHMTTQRGTSDLPLGLAPSQPSDVFLSSFSFSNHRQLCAFPRTRTGLCVHLLPSDYVGKRVKKARVEMLDDAACVQHQRPPFVVRKVDPDLITSRGYLSDPLEEPVETPGNLGRTERQSHHSLFDASFDKPSVTVIKHATPTHKRQSLFSEQKATQTSGEDTVVIGSVSHSDSECDAGNSRVHEAGSVEYSDDEEKDDSGSEMSDLTEDETKTFSVGKSGDRNGHYGSRRYQPLHTRHHTRRHSPQVASDELLRRRGNLRSSSVEPAEKIHQKIDNLLRKYQWKQVERSGGSSDEDELETTLRRIKSSHNSSRAKRQHNKSMTVHLGGDDYWSDRMKEWTGRPHRLLFDETLEKAYSRLYQQATDIS